MNSSYQMKAIGKKGYIFLLIAIAFLNLVESGCKNYLEVDPPIVNVNAGNVFRENTTAIAVVTAIYAKMSNTYLDQGPTAVSLYPELSADNLALFDRNANLTYTKYYQNFVTSDYQGASTFWTTFYPLIYSCNAAIEGLSASSELNPAVKTRLLGEAYFIRAFNYFYLTNLYGDVPLVTSTVFQTNIEVAKSPVAKVYELILEDLNKAKKLLDNKYLDGTLLTESTERIRPNLGAVNALLARVNLYLKNYAAAESASTEVINQSGIYSSELPLNQIFLRNSKETIWSLQPVKRNFNTDEGDLYTLPNGGPNGSHPFYASDSFLNSFEAGDQRKDTWLGSVKVGVKTYFYPAKYKIIKGAVPVSEYTIMLRVAEQYLIRAEARNEQNNKNGAIEDLNLIRSRSRAESTIDAQNPLPNLNGNLLQTEIRSQILKERRVELFIEGGHRWLDLKRTGEINNVMNVASQLKGGSWEPYKAVYPIPLSEILLSHVLIQNSGYN